MAQAEKKSRADILQERMAERAKLRGASATGTPTSQKSRADILQERIQQRQEQPGWGSWLAQTAKGAGSEALNRAGAMASSAASTATLGAAPAIVDRLAAGADAVMDSGEMSYGDFLKKRQQDRASLEDSYPISSMVGAVGGGLLPAGRAAEGAALIKEGGGTLGNLLSSMTSTGLRRIGTAAAAGGAANALTDLNTGRADSLSDVLQSTGVGAIGGGIGQAVGEVAPSALRFIRERVTTKDHKALADRLVGESLFDDALGRESVAAAANGGKGFDVDELLDLAQNGPMVGPNQTMLAEKHPGLLRAFAGLSTKGDVTGMTDVPAELAGRRLSANQASRQELLDYLDNANRATTGRAAKAETAQAREQGKAMMQQIFDTPEGRNLPVTTKKELLAGVKDLKHSNGVPVFDLRNANDSTRSAYNYVTGQIKALGGKSKDATLAGLQSLQHQLDDRLSSAKRGPQSSADLISTRELASARRFVNEKIAELDPRFKEASALFASDKQAEAARELGDQLIKGSKNIDDLREEVAALTPAEKWFMQDRAKELISGKLADKPDYLKNLAAKNPGMMERFKILFGDSLASHGTGIEDIASNLETLSKQDRAYKTLQAAPERGASYVEAVPNTNEGLLSSLGTLAAGAQAAHGRVANSGFVANLMRSAANPSDAVNQVLFELLKEVDEGKAVKAIQRVYKASRKKAPSGLGGLIGASGISTILD